MKFIISKNELEKKLKGASGILTKTTIPALNNILFQVGEKSSVTISNNETRLNSIIEVSNFDEAFDFCVDAKTFIDFLKTISEQPIDISIIEKSVLIKHASGEFSMSKFEANEYPIMPVEETKETVKISSGVLLMGIHKTIKFSKNDHVFYPLLSAVYVSIRKDKTFFYATDQQQMARCIDECENTLETSILINRMAANVLKSILPSNEDIEITTSEKNITFKFGDITLKTRCIEGNFPNCEGVISKPTAFSAIINKQLLSNALKRILLANEIGIVKIKFQEGKLELSAESTAFANKAIEIVECDYKEELIVFGVSLVNMIEIVNDIDSDDIKISFSGMASPVNFTPSESNELLYLLMPCQV